MALFKKRAPQPVKAATTTTALATTTTPAATTAPTTAAAVAAVDAAPSGPLDVADVPELGMRIDLGALRVPVAQGTQVRMELDRATQQITGVTITLSADPGAPSLQLQAFAAPKKAGIWDDIRAELLTGIQAANGTADDVPGEFGRELIARIPGPGPGGKMGVKAARFVGVDGPRWFVRGVFTGDAATDPEAAKALEDVFRGVVVNRGDTPRPPRDLLPLQLPATAEKLADGAPDTEGAAGARLKPSIDPFRRGPEITEIR